MSMPAGEYYVGDLCYVMHPEWDEFCRLTIKGNDCIGGEFNLADGRRFASYNTAYGDGVYADNLGNEYGVDAGLIGCILVSDIAESERKNIKDGNVHVFPAPFSTGESGGEIRFGHIMIDTE